jgi:transcriptional regulator EpsA
LLEILTFDRFPVERDMRADEQQMAAKEHLFPFNPEALNRGEDRDDPDSFPSFLDSMELESLGLALEFSLKVHTTHQFYCWAQGLLQNLIRHELLICALHKGESASFHVDSFSTTATQPALINSLFAQDTSLVPHLIKAWEENHFQPVTRDIRKESSSSDSGLVGELKRIGADQVLAHGTYDSFGKLVSFFIFACRPGANLTKQSHLAKLLVPSLHAAWVHTQFIRPAAMESARARPGGRDLLTPREQDILNWIYRGKSNIEIGIILGLSPFTVKNHVQKILRRLKVMNRAQAVGKALVLRIFDGASLT